MKGHVESSINVIDTFIFRNKQFTLFPCFIFITYNIYGTI